jgi:hypothetical protein
MHQIAPLWPQFQASLDRQPAPYIQLIPPVGFSRTLIRMTFLNLLREMAAMRKLE